MSYVPSLTPSPVVEAFSGIQWDPLGKLRLTNTEKSLLRSGEDNPVDYTLSNNEDACLYVRALLKVLAEACGASGPSAKVSHLREPLSLDDALQILYIDATGVVTHYAISKLVEVIMCLRERKDGAEVSMLTTFYDGDTLINEWRPLLRILHLGGSGDPFAQKGAAMCLANILLVGCPSQTSSKSIPIDYSSVKEPLQALLSWITSQLQSSSGSSVSLVTSTLISLVNCPEARSMFAENGGIGYIARHLRTKQSSKAKGKNKGATVQQLYELTFCLWAMTYDCNDSAAVRLAFVRDGAVSSLANVLNSAPREKVVRVALSALRNLAECTAEDNSELSKKKVVDGSVFLTDMMGCGVLKSVDFMMERQWSDPDIVEDLEALSSLLHENYKEMSRWDIYEAEVESGNLTWGILHSEKFFKENCRRLEGRGGDFSLLKILISLASSEDDEISSVACFDIGEFVRHYPNGRSIAKRLGAKEAVMGLIEHENPDLQRQALLCVSKMMVQNWSALQ